MAIPRRWPQTPCTFRLGEPNTTSQFLAPYVARRVRRTSSLPRSSLREAFRPPRSTSPEPAVTPSCLRTTPVRAQGPSAGFDSTFAFTSIERSTSRSLSRSRGSTPAPVRPASRAASTVVTRLERPAWLPRLVLVRLAARLDASRKMPVSNFCNRPDPISSTLRIVRLPTACTFVRRRPQRASPDLRRAARRGAGPRGLTRAIRPRVGSRLTTRPSFGPSTSLFSRSSRSREDGLASEASSPRRCRP